MASIPRGGWEPARARPHWAKLPLRGIKADNRTLDDDDLRSSGLHNSERDGIVDDRAIGEPDESACQLALFLALATSEAGGGRPRLAGRRFEFGPDDGPSAASRPSGPYRWQRRQMLANLPVPPAPNGFNAVAGFHS